MNASLLSRHSVGRRQREGYHLDGMPESLSVLMQIAHDPVLRSHLRSYFAIPLPSRRMPNDADGALTAFDAGATLCDNRP
jgi:hypothetical protein